MLRFVSWVLLSSPVLVGCSKHSPTKPVPAIASYALVAAWGDSGSADGQFRNPRSVATGASGNVYVVDAGNSRIQEFTSTGVYLSQWGGGGSSNGQFNSPRHLAVDTTGNVYVADTGNHRIQKFSGDGTYLAQWGSQGSRNGQFQFPGGVATHDGNVYVTDTGNHRIQTFSSTGVYLSQWGTSGSANGQFQAPQGVAVDDSGNVYVADSDDDAGGYHHRIQKFTSTGTYLTGWGGYGHGDGQLYSPDGVALDASGNVFVTDLYNWRIQKFTRMGTYLTQWSTGRDARGVGAPGGIAVDAFGNVYVAEWNFFYRIQKFAPTGSHIASLVAGSAAHLRHVCTSRVEREDEMILEAVQRELKSPLYSHGRYSPARWGSASLSSGDRGGVAGVRSGSGARGTKQALTRQPSGSASREPWPFSIPRLWRLKGRRHQRLQESSNHAPPTHPETLPGPCAAARHPRSA